MGVFSLQVLQHVTTRATANRYFYCIPPCTAASWPVGVPCVQISGAWGKYRFVNGEGGCNAAQAVPSLHLFYCSILPPTVVTLGYGESRLRVLLQLSMKSSEGFPWWKLQLVYSSKLLSVPVVCTISSGTCLKPWIGSHCTWKSDEFCRENIFLGWNHISLFHRTCHCHLLVKGDFRKPHLFSFSVNARLAPEFCSLSMLNEFAVFDNTGMNES